MAQTVSWIVNAALVALGCFLLAQSANAVIGALLTPSPVGDASTGGAPAPAVPASTGIDVILTRNLFNASLLTPAEPVIADEALPLEATQLPLNLLGTAAADIPEQSWAAIEDRESQQTLVLRIGDSVRNQASVTRIERKRVVLDEGGTLRELALGEPEGVLPPMPRPLARANPPRRPLRPQPAVAPAPELDAMRSPAQLFSEARILPKYQEGQMVGVQVSSIKPGSLFERIGLQEGDVITELNGLRIDSPEQSAKILLELTKAETFAIQVDGTGGTRSLSYELPSPR